MILRKALMGVVVVASVAQGSSAKLADQDASFRELKENAALVDFVTSQDQLQEQANKNRIRAEWQLQGYGKIRHASSPIYVASGSKITECGTAYWADASRNPYRLIACHFTNDKEKNNEHYVERYAAFTQDSNRPGFKDLSAEVGHQALYELMKERYEQEQAEKQYKKNIWKNSVAVRMYPRSN